MNSGQHTDSSPLWAAPYRPFFAFGFGWGMIVLSLWVLQLLSNAGLDVPLLPDAIDAGEHAHLMLWGVWGSFVFGFSLTAHPRQSGTAAPAPGKLRRIFIVFALAQVFGLLAVLGMQVVALSGKVLELAAYLWLAQFCVRASAHRFRMSGFAIHSAVFSFAMCVGAITNALHAFGPVSMHWIAVHTALWGWLVTLVVVFGSLLVPTFTRLSAPGGEGATTGRWFLHGFIILAWILPGLRQSAGPTVFAAGNGVWFLWCAAEWLRWKPLAGMRVPLLLPMHMGWLWLLVSLAVGALRPFEEALYLHALNATHVATLGCLGSFILAVTSRVSQAHAGQVPTLGRAGLLALALLQAGALLRIVGGALGQPWLAYAGAGMLVIAAFGIWLMRYGRLLFAPSA